MLGRSWQQTKQMCNRSAAFPLLEATQRPVKAVKPERVVARAGLSLRGTHPDPNVVGRGMMREALSSKGPADEHCWVRRLHQAVQSLASVHLPRPAGQWSGPPSCGLVGGPGLGPSASGLWRRGRVAVEEQSFYLGHVCDLGRGHAPVGGVDEALGFLDAHEDDLGVRELLGEDVAQRDGAAPVRGTPWAVRRPRSWPGRGWCRPGRRWPRGGGATPCRPHPHSHQVPTPRAAGWQGTGFPVVTP